MWGWNEGYFVFVILTSLKPMIKYYLCLNFTNHPKNLKIQPAHTVARSIL